MKFCTKNYAAYSLFTFPAISVEKKWPLKSFRFPKNNPEKFIQKTKFNL